MRTVIWTFFLSQALMPALHAQVINVHPALPGLLDEVVVTFHADEGNQGLIDYLGEVYVHAGLITTSSTNPGDWKHVVSSWGGE